MPSRRESFIESLEPAAMERRPEVPEAGAA
jgi:hypothetical protein